MPIAMGKNQFDIAAFHTLHAIALRKWKLGQMEDAEKCCKAAARRKHDCGALIAY